MSDIGLALSGGGSRAAAFHRGTVEAMIELGLVPRIRTLSSVSGGSVFAAAWMAARARKQGDDVFLAWMRDVLERGFIKPALLSWRAVKMLWPGWSRTRRIAETFDEVLFRGLTWSDLPETPLLCLNTTVLNNAASGRFSRGGFSAKGVGKRTEDGYDEVAMNGVSIGFATAASAAFPFGLPPLSLARKRFGDVAFGEGLEKHPRLVLTDGGIVENLGIERLLQSKRFGTKHVITSDAGVRDRAWLPSWILGRLRSSLIYALSSETLERLLGVMNDKQNRSMRQLLFSRLGEQAREDRRFVFVRLQQDWDGYFEGVPPGLRESVDLSKAEALYKEMGGDKAVVACNAVATGFNGLSRATLDLLAAHARWQVHAGSALFAKDLLQAA